jgi:hypothetical protein
MPFLNLNLGRSEAQLPKRGPFRGHVINVCIGIECRQMMNASPEDRPRDCPSGPGSDPKVLRTANCDPQQSVSQSTAHLDDLRGLEIQTRTASGATTEGEAGEPVNGRHSSDDSKCHGFRNSTGVIIKQQVNVLPFEILPIRNTK